MAEQSGRDRGRQKYKEKEARQGQERLTCSTQSRHWPILAKLRDQHRRHLDRNSKPLQPFPIHLLDPKGEGNESLQSDVWLPSFGERNRFDEAKLKGYREFRDRRRKRSGING